MKKFTVLAVAVMLVFGIAGVASAISFTDTESWGFFGKELSGDGIFTWDHATPADFEVPFDVINSATIEIFASFVDGSNDAVLVEGTIVGTLTNQDWVWSLNPFPGYWEGAEFDIAAQLDPWSTGDILNVSLNYDEPNRRNKLYLYSSIFTLDYENVTAPVPEPGTVLLLGGGLLGLIALKRKLR